MGSTSSALVQIFRSGKNLYTPHGPDEYPGLVVFRGTPEWSLGILCPEVGQRIEGRGGERALPYRTPGGGEAQGFVLEPGDRATLLRDDLHHCLAEWRVERRAPGV